MYSGYYYPYYRSFGFNYPVYGQPYGYYPTNYGYGYSNNIIGSAIANQGIVNTGTMTGTTQVANPTVIW